MKKMIPYVLFALFIYLLPILMAGSYWIHVLVIIGIYVIAAVGVDLVVGFAGQLSLCQAAFFSLGAYASAILTTTYHFHPLPAMIVGMVFTALVAYGVGAPVLRLKGYYLAIATLGFGLIIQSLFVTMAKYTGGPDGFRDSGILCRCGWQGSYLRVTRSIITRSGPSRWWFCSLLAISSTPVSGGRCWPCAAMI